jgi:hypothetical protein
MNATVAWSYHLLEPAEQRAFRRFGVCRVAFPLTRLKPSSRVVRVLAGSDEALRAAADLIDKSLLLRVDNSVVATCPLYHMLETVRARGPRARCCGRARRRDGEGWCAIARPKPRSPPRALSDLRRPNGWTVQEDCESYRAVLTWLIERARPTEAADIAWRLVFFWLIRWHAAEGLRWYEQILNLPNLVPAAESRALVGAALMWFTQGELSRARAALTRAHSLAVGAGDMDMVVRADDLSARVEHALGNLDGARERFIRAIEGFEALGLPGGVGNARSGWRRWRWRLATFNGRNNCSMRQRRPCSTRALGS